jgi:cell division septation protein DedD
MTKTKQRRVRRLVARGPKISRNLTFIRPAHQAILSTFERLESRQLLSHTWYVSPSGSNSNVGTADDPFQTIQAAANVAEPGDTVLIHAGTYRETVTPANSGRPGAPITYKAYGDGTVTISGADVVSGFNRGGGSTYTTYNDSWDLGEGNNQVFVDGQMINEARWPNTSLDLSHPTLATASSNTPHVVAQGQWTTSTLRDPKLNQPAGFWDGATIDILPGQQWVAQTGTVISSSPGQLTYRYQQMNVPYSLPSAGDRFYLFGTPGALDAPEEWYRNPGTGALSVWAPGSANPNHETIEVKRRQDAFNLVNKSYVDIQGISLFAATIQTNGNSNGIVLNQLDAKYVSQFAINPNGWAEPTITGIQLAGSDSILENSLIQYSAGNGVCLTGSKDTVDNCVITDTDYSATTCSAIEVRGADIHIEYNTIYNAARDGIKLSHSTDTIVLNNLIHDVMLRTTDGGGIYTYGTNGSGSEIAYNRVYNIHSGGYGAVGVYLDNGSSHYLVEHNVISECDWAVKLNPPSHDNTIQDNVLADSGAPIGTSGDRDMTGTVFKDNTYNGKLTPGPGASTVGNSYQVAPNLTVAKGAGADVTMTPTPTPSPTSPTPTPTTPTPTSPNPTPTPTPTVGASNTGGMVGVTEKVFLAFQAWHKTHKHMSRYHTDFYVFTHPGYKDP